VPVNPFANIKKFYERAFSQKLGKFLISEAMLDKALRYASDEVTPLVRSYLSQNYKNKGMGSHAPKVTQKGSAYKHGQLERVVNNAVVVLNRKGSGLVYTMPPGQPNEFYMIANSLQYGWTRGKNKNVGQQQIAQAMGRTGGNRRSSIAGRSKSKRNAGGKRSKGFGYFTLNGSQDREVTEKFFAAFESSMTSQLNGGV